MSLPTSLAAASDVLKNIRALNPVAGIDVTEVTITVTATQVLTNVGPKRVKITLTPKGQG